MRHTVIGVILTLTMSTVSFAADESGAGAVVAAHKRFFDAYKSCNTAVLNTLVASDMQFLHAGGMLQDKKSFVDGVGTCSLTDLTSEIINTRIYGDTGIVTGKLNYKMKMGGGALFFTETFVKKNGEWIFVSHQSTEPAAPAKK